MPIYEYQGKTYDIDTTDHTEAKNKILAYLGTPAKVETFTPPPVEASTSEGLGAGFLNRALGLSRGLGGDVVESQVKSQQAADVYSKTNPFAVGLGGAAVDIAAAAPGLVAAVPATAALGGGGLAAMGMEGLLGGTGTGLARGGERYQEVLTKTGSPEKALQAALASGASGIVDVGLPASLGGGLTKRIVGGAGLNVLSGEADVAAQNKILADYKDLQREQFDPTNMAINAVTGGLFGAAGPRAPFAKADVSEPKVDTTTTKTIDEGFTGQSLVDRQVKLAEIKRNFIEQDLKDLQLRATQSDLSVEDRVLMQQKEAELVRVNEDIAKLTGQDVAAMSGKTGIPEVRTEPELTGRVGGEEPAETIVVYDVKGNPVSAKILGTSESGAKLISINGKEQLLGFEHTETNPLESNKILQEKSQKELDARLATKMQHLEEQIQSGATNQVGFFETVREINAIKSEQRRRLSVETPPRTDVGAPRIDEQPQGATVVSREEGVSPLSDVPPHLQLEDRALDGVKTEDIIKETPMEKGLGEIDSRLDELEGYRQNLEDRLTEYHENPNRNSPDDMMYLHDELQRVNEQIDSRLEQRGKIVEKNAAPREGVLSNQAREELANTKLQQAIVEGKSVTETAGILSRVYALADKGVHYVGDGAGRKFITDTVLALNKLVGQDDKLIIVHAPESFSGHYTAVGNTHVLFVSDVRKSNYSFLNTIPEWQRNRAALLANIGHEYGHYFHTKLVQAYGKDAPLLQKLKGEYDKYVAGMEGRTVETVHATPISESYLGKDMYVQQVGYFKQFPEFVAETFNRAILHGTVPKNPFLAALYNGLRKINNKIFAELEQLGIRVSKDDFTSQYFSEYFQANREFMERSAKEMNDNSIKSMIDAKIADNPNALRAEDVNNQLESFYKMDGFNEFQPINSTKVVEEQKKVEDIGWFSTKIWANSFGSPQIVNILSNVPVIKAVYQAIRNADAESSRIVKSLMEGVTSMKDWQGRAIKKGFVTSLKKFQDADSPAVLMKKLKNADFAAIEQVFRKGFDEGLDYKESLVKFGSGLSEDQKHAFTVFSDLFQRQYDEVVKLQKDMGKKNILPQRKGWYPAVRKGEHYMQMSMNGVPVYRQQVRTLAEAERLVREAQKSGKFAGLEITAGKNMDTRIEAEQRDFLADAIMRELQSRGEFKGLQYVEDLLDKIYERGGKLGKHHEQRMNILGYKGSELFGSVDQRGLSFKDAIDSSVKEYAGSLRKMMISRNTDAILKTPEGLDQSHPNSMEAATLMRDMAMSKVDSRVSAFDNMVNQTFDKLFFKLFGKESRLPVYERVSGLMTSMFYTTTLTMKPAFWIGQALTSPTSIRHILREANPLKAMESAGKGTLNMFRPSEDFLKCVHWLSQNTETYHPQFANELTHIELPKFLASESTAGKIVNFIRGETPSQAADTFSRYWTSAMMFEHYKSKGLTGKALYEAVANATDTTMVQYGKRYRAPYLAKLGIVGEAMAPLHTFSTAQWGNFVSDVKHMASGKGVSGKLKNSAPLIATFLTTTLLGGVIGAPLVAEYELIRKAFGLEETLPSIVDWAVSDSPRLLSHGALSYSGFDMGSTQRWSPIAAGIVEANGSLADMFPAMKFAGSTVSNLFTIGKKKAGGDVSEAEYRTAVRGITPRGPMMGLMEDLKFGATERSMVPTGGRGYGMVPQTGKERAADYLGTSTMEKSLESKQFSQQREAEQTRTEKVQKQIDIAVDSLKNGNKEAYSKAINKLLELGVQPDSITSQMKTAIQNRGRGLLERFVFGASGKGTSAEQQRKLLNVMEYR